jgi:flagellar biosynthesis protein FlhB
MTEPDPRAYLETEARIIVENETHVAIALRLEKATIARNLPFLAALADLMPALKTLSAIHD